MAEAARQAEREKQEAIDKKKADERAEAARHENEIILAEKLAL